MTDMDNHEDSIERIFGLTLSLPPAERAAFLDYICCNAPEVRKAVEELLLEDDCAGSFLKKPILSPASICATTLQVVPTSELVGPGCKSKTFRFKPGDTVASRFVVLRFIARGGMGEVYEVEDRLLRGAHVALKVILPGIASDADTSRWFEQEVLLARKIIHRNLCPIYEIFRCEEPPPSFLFLTMKLLTGETLESFLRKRWLITKDDVIAIFHQMVSGIAAIHEAGVIHRDIKPNNVMVDRSGGPELRLSIMDFGLARLYASANTVLGTGMIVGTPGYLAPELLRGLRPSQASDIFALGVVLHQVLTGDRPIEAPDAVSVKESSSLASADIPSAYIQAVRQFLSQEPQRRCDAFEQIKKKIEFGGDVYRLVPPRQLWTRRNFVIASTASICVAAGVSIQGHQRIYEMLHPLPNKRFVAILGWPPPVSTRTKPLLLSLIDAMANELARAESFDHNFFITALSTAIDMKSPDQLNETRESLGANLILATSVVTGSRDFRVFLRVFPSPSTTPLRTRQVEVPLEKETSLPGKVVRAAAELLDLHDYEPNDDRSRVATNSPEALTAYQAAEALMKQPNNAGLDDAIERYKQAVEIDPRYSLAHARLAIAYLRLYALYRDPTSITLARANSDTSLALDHKSVEGHVALASVYQETGAEEDALREMKVALSLDPSDTRTMTYQAQIFTRLNRWQGAEETLGRVLKARPNYWLAYNQLGFAFNSQGKYSQALQAFQAASIVAPKNAMVFNNLGAVYFQLGNYEEAVAALKKSMALSPNGDAAASLADAFRAQGDNKDALRSSLEAVKLSPDESTNWLELGDSYSRVAHHIEDAFKAYQRAAQLQEKQLETDPTNGPGWMLLALYQAKLGDFQKAYFLIRKADVLGSDDLSAQLNKVRILELTGKHEEASATMMNCLKRGVTISQIRAMNDLDRFRALM